jgi:hypothetical protein
MSRLAPTHENESRAQAGETLHERVPIFWARSWLDVQLRAGARSISADNWGMDGIQ